MRKFTYIFIPVFIIFSLCLCSCSLSFKKSKPKPYFYTDSLIKAMNRENNFICYAIDTNYYKKIELTGENLSIIKGFIKCIKSEDFINDPNIKNDPPYKIYFKFKKEEYIINVYDEKYISLYPYDGVYPMDYLDSSKVYKYYSLYSLMKFLYLR